MSFIKSCLSISCYLFFTSLTSHSQNDSPDAKASNVLSVIQKVIEEENFMDELSIGKSDEEKKLPIGIIKQIGAARYIIAVDSIHYKENKSCFNAYAAIDFPGTTKKIAFSGTNIQFNPKGVVGSTQAKLMLVSNVLIKINNTVSLQLKNDGTNWVEWDCKGFKSINLKGYFIFQKDKLKPDSTQTSEKFVTASFEIHTENIHNFIAQVNITPFVVEGLKNWSFKVENATVDMSELSNAASMSFPIGYSNPNMVTPAMWTGFYLQSLKVKLPTEISKTGKRTEILVNNLLIDHMGISGLFQANNVFATSEGNMSGWKFSIDELSVGFVCNEFSSGHIKGEINLPVMEEDQTMKYDASVYYNPSDRDIDYCFKVSPGNGFEFNMFSAKVKLNNNSLIIIEKANHIFKPSAVLHGFIEFTSSKLNTSGSQLTFQDLTIITKAPYLTNGVFTLHTNGSQTKAAKYPASINDISFGINNGAPVIGFSVTVNLTENSSTGFGGGVLVKIQGKIESEEVNYQDDVPVSYTKSQWKFDKVVIGGISIDVATAPCKIKGLIVFRENDPIYGNGFFGQVELKIEKVIPNPITITSCFGVKDEYRYFYVDAAVPVNIPLGSIPITLNKIMGGLYYHMKPQNSSQAQLIDASKNQSSSQTTALSYIPDNTISLGFKAGVGFKYTPSARTANGDVMLEVAFTSSGGLSFIKLCGDVYIMAEPSQRQKAPIIGNIVIQYDAENKVFDANATITINAYNAVTGKGVTKIHIEPALWYVCAGKPSTPNYINILSLVKATSYFMVGNSIEPALAPPVEVTNIINNGAQTEKRNNDALSSGSGFCTGAKIVSDIHKKFGYKDFSVQGDYNFTLGFDMMMLNYGANGYCSGSDDKIGMNGWLAEGAMYIAMSGGVKITGTCSVPVTCYKEMDGPPYPCPEKGNLLKTCTKKINVPYPCMVNQTFDKPVFSAAVAAMVQGKLPKPLYFRGDFACQYEVMGILKGDFKFDYEYGTNCSPVKAL